MKEIFTAVLSMSLGGALLALLIIARALWLSGVPGRFCPCCVRCSCCG